MKVVLHWLTSMHLLSWADNRTIVACHCLLAAVFAVLLLAARKLQPHMEGIGSLALGCFLGLPTAILLASRGHIPLFASAWCAGVLAFLTYILLYRGLLLFCAAQNMRMHDATSCRSVRRFPGSGRRRESVDPRFNRSVYRGHVVLLCVVCAISLCALFYFTQIHESVQAQIVIASSTMAVARGLMAWSLFRNAARRTHLLLFGSSLAAFAAVNVYHTIATLMHGAPHDLMDFDGIQTATWAGSLLFIGVNGMFYVTMINFSVVEMVTENAQLDFVTSTLNRRGIETALEVEIERAHRRSQPVAVLLIDLDHFKTINDRFGHAAGDQALREIAHCISTTVRAYDSVGRFGGDEFLVLLPDTCGDQAVFLAARMRDAARSVLLPEGAASMTLSIGATHSVAKEEASEILARADAALYLAKQSGRDCARLQVPPPIALTSPSGSRARSTPTLSTPVV
jgi:diguanylate cyclase (GGDEF)-like protein